MRQIFIDPPKKRGYISENMKKALLTILFILFSQIAFGGPTLKSRLTKANEGDFVVTAQGNIYSLLLIRSIEKERLVLEEVTIDQDLVDLKKVNWHQWIEKKAPGALSWNSYGIDLENNVLSQCFSHFQKQWIFIEKSDYYFAKLLTMDLRPTKDIERKKIGPAPMPGEIDRRKFWKPQMIREGKKISKPLYEVVRTKWPDDKTKLAGCIFELYLDADNTQFPFPYWMEVQHPHYTFKIRAVDSGRGICSPIPKL